MKTIDFLPSQYREQHAQRTKTLWHGAVIAAYAGLLFAASYTQQVRRQGIEGELAIARQRHQAVVALSAELTARLSQLEAVRAEAELITYLRHPWPRTQIVAAVVKALPEEVSLEQVHLERQAVEAAPTPVRAPARARPPGPEEGQPDHRPKAQRDLAALREACDPARIVVLLKGTFREDAAVHVYLSELNAAGLFSKIELQSMGGSRFSARLTLRPGFGQPGGPVPPTRPTTPPAEKLALASQGAPASSGRWRALR
jgi:hypothetical protein